MVFGSDDAALRAVAEPHMSLILELNLYCTNLLKYAWWCFLLEYPFLVSTAVRHKAVSRLCQDVATQKEKYTPLIPVSFDR
jgi:hypothetical protein